MCLSKSPTRGIESEHDKNSTAHPEEDQYDVADTDGNVSMEAGPPSLNAPMPEPNESRPIIISICNPLNEESSNRQNHPSEVFCTNPNPVQVPSWIKDSKCK